MKYLFMDTETGGLDPNETSLLSLYMAVYDQDFKLQEELDLLLKPSDFKEDNIYRINPSALEINKIDIISHNKNAISLQKASTIVYDFLSRNSLMGADKLIPTGHNVNFDLGRVFADLMSRNTWEKFCSYRMLDTAVIGKFLQISGSLPAEVTGSLTSFSKLFGLDASQAHNARADVQLTIGVLKNFLKVIKEPGYCGAV